MDVTAHDKIGIGREMVLNTERRCEESQKTHDQDDEGFSFQVKSGKYVHICGEQRTLKLHVDPSHFNHRNKYILDG